MFGCQYTEPQALATTVAPSEDLDEIERDFLRSEQILWDSPKGIITSGFQRYKILSQTRSGPLKRTIAAYTVLLGLTAVMIGHYLGEFKTLAEILRGYTFLLP